VARPSKAGPDDPSRGAPGPPLSKKEYVRQQLRAQILDGRLTPGHPLRHEEIAAQLGVSQTPVREALWRLESEGLVEYHSHRGATVADLPENAITELYLLRAEVEGLASRLAADRVDDAAISGLRERHEAMLADLDTWDPAELAAASREFHAAIAEVGGPAFLAGHIRWLWASYPVPPSESLWKAPENARTFLQAHEEILDALTRRDGVAAQRLMAEHIRHAADVRALTFRQRR
jgi:DNA-binding GntR family transcriptional regulator